MAVTGPKTDLWLVEAFALLIAAFGLVLGYAAIFRKLGSVLELFGAGDRGNACPSPDGAHLALRLMPMGGGGARCYSGAGLRGKGETAIS